MYDDDDDDDDDVIVAMMIKIMLEDGVLWKKPFAGAFGNKVSCC